MEFGGAFWKLPNLKNIIFIDGGRGGIVYSNTPIDTVIFNASGDTDTSSFVEFDTINGVVYDTPPAVGARFSTRISPTSTAYVSTTALPASPHSRRRPRL